MGAGNQGRRFCVDAAPCSPLFPRFGTPVEVDGPAPGLTWGFLVGDAGVEPTTSAV